MCETASRARLASDLNLSLVELYTDKTPLCDGLCKAHASTSAMAFRRSGQKRAVAERLISGQIISAAARQLNSLYRADPRY